MLTVSREVTTEWAIRNHSEEQMPSPAGPWQWFLLRGKKTNTARMYSPSRQHRRDCKQDSPSNDPFTWVQPLQIQHSKAKRPSGGFHHLPGVTVTFIYTRCPCSQAWGSDSTPGFVIKCFRVCVHIPKQYEAYHFNLHLPKTIGRWKEIRQNPVREFADIIKAQKKTCSEFPL